MSDWLFIQLFLAELATREHNVATMRSFPNGYLTAWGVLAWRVRSFRFEPLGRDLQLLADALFLALPLGRLPLSHKAFKFSCAEARKNK